MPYDSEPVDRLPFGTAEKAGRYATERYLGATGRNWWRCDPTLQFLDAALTSRATSWPGPSRTSTGWAR